ncbi:MAG: restriction system protein [Paracoccaceae bacterium]|jgi:restriction system protein
MSIPDYQTFMLPVLRLLAQGCANVNECLPGLRTALAIDDAEAAELLPSGKQTVLASRAHWARTYLGKAGLIESPRRNLHVVTARGHEMLAQNPDRIDNAALERFAEFTAWKAAGRKDADVPDEPLAPVSPGDATPEERLRAAYAEIESALADDLLQAVRQTTPARFERLVVDLLIAMGYGKGDPARGAAIGKSGDGGIDGIVNEDALGLDAVYLQAKRYAEGNTVGRPAVQGFVGSMTGESATKGVFVTTSGFSAGAVEYVRMIQQRVVLIDGPRLARLMIAHGVGVRTAETYLVRSLDEQAFDD